MKRFSIALGLLAVLPMTFTAEAMAAQNPCFADAAIKAKIQGFAKRYGITKSDLEKCENQGVDFCLFNSKNRGVDYRITIENHQGVDLSRPGTFACKNTEAHVVYMKDHVAVNEYFDDERSIYLNKKIFPKLCDSAEASQSVAKALQAKIDALQEPVEIANEQVCSYSERHHQCDFQFKTLKSKQTFGVYARLSMDTKKMGCEVVELKQPVKTEKDYGYPSSRHPVESLLYRKAVSPQENNAAPSEMDVQDSGTSPAQ